MNGTDELIKIYKRLNFAFEQIDAILTHIKNTHIIALEQSKDIRQIQKEIDKHIFETSVHNNSIVNVPKWRTNQDEEKKGDTNESNIPPQ